MEVDKKGMDYIFSNMVGSGGKAQWKVALVTFITNLSGGVPLFMHMFAAYTPEHRCKVPICEGRNDTEWLNFALPPNEGSSNFLKTNEKFDSCKVYQVIDPSGECISENFALGETVKCKEWVYDETDYKFTISTIHNLVCDSEPKRRLLGTILMLGLMLGSLIGGKLGDYLGRKVSSFIAIGVIIPSILFGGYAPSYEIYAALRLVTCTCLPILWVCLHSLSIELFGKERREKFVVVKDLFYPCYVVILGGLSYCIRDYANLHIAIGCLCCLSLLTWPFIPESVRWEIVNNKYDRARKTLMNIAKDNGKNLKIEDEEKIDKILHEIHDEAQESAHKGKHQIWDIFRKKELKVTLVLMVNWITVVVSAYTLTLNTTKMSGNIWLNFVLSAWIEIPTTAVIYLLLKKLGRRTNLFLFQAIMSLSCFILAFIPKEFSTAVLVVYLIGKIGSGASFLMIWLLPVELYPTNLRAQGLGTLSTISRMFGMSSSFVATAAVYWKPLPLLIVGIPSFIAGLMAFLLPETAGKELPQFDSRKKSPKEIESKL